MANKLELLMQATDYVENQASINNGVHVVSPPLHNNHSENAIKENGHFDQNSLPNRRPTIEETLSHNHLNKQSHSRNVLGQDDQSVDKEETMRLHYSSELSSSEEAAGMTQYNRDFTNGVLSRINNDEKYSGSSFHSRMSPQRSPARKISSSPISKSDGEHRVKLPAPSSHSLSSLGTHTGATNPLLPFIHPIFSTVDQNFYADLARRNMVSTDVTRIGSSSASPASVSSAVESLSAQGLSRYMYQLPANHTLMMGARAPTAPAFAFPDLSMVFPPHLAAAFGQSAGLLPQQLAGWPTFESLPGLTPGQVPTQWLTNPYLRNYLSANNPDLAAHKDVSRGLSKPAVLPGVPLPGYYPADFFHGNESLKQEEVLTSRSLSPRKSTSPDSIKRTSAPVHPSFLNPASLAKSSLAEWKYTATSSKASKLEAGQSSIDSRLVNSTLRRDAKYGEHDVQIRNEDIKQKNVGLPPRLSPSTDVYGHRYITHEQQSQSPSSYTERWDNRRRSRDFSPHPSSTNGEKTAQKRSHEGFNITRELIPDFKNHNPSVSPLVGSLRQTKSPQRRCSKSPVHQSGQPSSVNSLLIPPYLFHQSYPGGLPFALPTFCPPDLNVASSSRTASEVFTAASLSQASMAGSQFLRPPLSQERSMSDFTRLTGLQQYWLPQQLQQQIMKVNPEYAAALKQFAAIERNLQIESRDKEGSSSPSQNLSFRRFMQSQSPSPAPKTTGASAVPSQPKPIIKNPPHPLNHNYKAPSGASSNEMFDGGAIKHEAISPSPKYLSPAVPGSQMMTKPTSRLADDDRIVPSKRRGLEELNERSLKDTSMKGKKELTSDVDEHFRRSLGNDYKESDLQNKVLITGSVDDHFHKALGNVWDIYKLNRASSSPQPSNNLTNGKEIPATSNTVPPCTTFPQYRTAPLPTVVDTRDVTALSYINNPFLNSTSRTVKTSPTVYSESSSVSSAQVPPNFDVATNLSKRVPSESRSYPPAYDAASRMQNDGAKDSSLYRLPISPIDKKPIRSTQNGPSLSTVSPNPINKTSNTSENLYKEVTVAQVHPHIVSAANSFLKSPAKLPPAYSQTSASISSISACVSPHPNIDRQSSGDSNTTTAMSVQT